MYRGVPFIHRDHLLPAETGILIHQESSNSTFTYTNSVSQYAAFYSGQWATYERKITHTCIVQGGTLYLLSLLINISEVRIQLQKGRPVADFPPGLPRRIGKKPNIVIPNSMWTASCCVHSNGVVLAAFALIGNNDQNTRVPA